MGELFKVLAIADPKLGVAARVREIAAGASMMIEAATLTLPGIRHAFFTRAGGVSERPLCQPQWRHRLARRCRPCRGKSRAHGGGARRRAGSFAHRLSNPFAARRRRRDAVADARRGRAPTPSSPAPAASRSASRTADCGPVLLADPVARRDRRRACRLARRARPASPRRRSRRWSGSAPSAAASVPRSGR